MRFTATSTELQRILSQVAGVIPSRSTLPILENLLFEIVNDELRIAATDLDTSMLVNINVKGVKDGLIAVPGRRLFETVRALPNTDITFAAECENHRVVMTTENGEYRFTGESGDSYPPIPAFKSGEELELDCEVLRRLISKTAFAASTDELRPAMMGLLFQAKKKEIRVAATDGHRLVRIICSQPNSGKAERDFIIPAKALGLILKTADEGACRITFSDNHVMFTFGGSRLITRIIQENYPNYESVIPLENDKKLVVDRNQLLASVRRIALYSSTTTHQIRFALEKGFITISAEDIDLGSEAREKLSCDYSSDTMEIGFNSTYVIDLLTHIDTDEIEFLFGSPTRACVIQPFTQRQGEDILMLVMPVRLTA